MTGQTIEITSYQEKTTKIRGGRQVLIEMFDAVLKPCKRSKTKYAENNGKYLAAKAQLMGDAMDNTIDNYLFFTNETARQKYIKDTTERLRNE